MAARFPRWKPPEFDERGMTQWNWMCQHPEHLRVGKGSDVGAFTYINAKFGVDIGEDAQIGSHCSLYSVSTIDDKKGPIVIGRGARLGAHSVVMPGVTIGEGAVVGAFSFVTRDVPAGATAFGIPAKVVRKARSRDELP